MLKYQLYVSISYLAAFGGMLGLGLKLYFEKKRLDI